MRTFRIWAILVSLTAAIRPAFAQDLDPETAQPEAPSFATITPITNAGIWGKYVPRVGFRYDSGDSIGRRNGLSSFQGFLPILENENATALTFTDSRLLLDSEGANIGANVGIGQRFYLPNWNRTVGGYLYYDNRDTGAATFSQVSGGLESLGDIWDFRGNFYAPTGDDRKLLGEALTGTTSYFAQNSLILGGGLQTWETALAGFDYEAGARVWSIRGIDLRVFGGGYHFQGSGVPQAWGWKSRVEAVIADNVALSLAVQNDRVFDTTVNGGFAFYFPKRSARRWNDSRRIEVIDRLAEPIERIQNIVVDRTTTALPEIVAIDPNTGLPLFFLHVAPGGNSDGSFEDPYATLAEAVADPRAQAGGTIIYDRRDGVESNNIIVPANNRVLSAGPEQFVLTQLGLTLLPFSGSGIDSRIDGTVRLLDNTVFSGFGIRQATADNALEIAGSNVLVDRTTVEHGGSGAALVIDGTKNITLRDTVVLQNGSGFLFDIHDAGGFVDLSSTRFLATGGEGARIDAGSALISIAELRVLDGSNTGLAIFDFGGQLLIDHAELAITSGTAGLVAIGGSPDIAISNARINVSSGFSAVVMDTDGGSLLLAGDRAVVATNLGPVMAAVDIDANGQTLLLDIESIDADGFLNVGLVVQDMGANSIANFERVVVRHGTGGIVLLDNAGVTSFGRIKLNIDAGDGLVASNAGTVVANNPTNIINVQDGAALLLEDSAVDLAFQSITSGACLDGAINLDSVTGQLLVLGDSTIEAPCGPAISIVDSNVNLALGTNPGSQVIITDRMDEGIFISGTSGSLNFASTTIDNASFSPATPIDIQDSDAAITFASVTITDASDNAVELANLTQSIAINDGVIDDSGLHAINAVNISNLTINSVEIERTVDNAIHIVGVNNYTISNNTIADAGNDGIHIEDAQGTGVIRGNQIQTVLAAFQDAIEVEIVDDADTTIEDNTITSLLTVNTAVSVNIVGGTTSTRINNNEITSILNAFSTPILVQGSTTGLMDLEVRGNVITSTAGIFLGGGMTIDLDTVSADVTIADNVLTNNNLISAFGDGITVSITGLSNTTVSIVNNDIIDGTLAEGFDDSILVTLQGGGTSSFTISENLVTQNGFLGEDGIEFGNDGTNTQVTVQNNILNGSSLITAAGLNMFAFGGGTIAADITGNTTDSSLDLTNFLSTFGVVDLPNLSANNNGATVNTVGPIDNLP